MQRFSQFPECYGLEAPPMWRQTHRITGDYDFDASIEHCHNADMAAKLAGHISGSVWRNAYAPRTMYSGYSGLTGDD